ncbi:porin [Sphingomonas aerophila]|uniref:Porin n=1 Tax=Sphingomonas aerophila TaxID=1344948 RepID=A0A7W9EWT2_9SPHN|nr:carbohydrate porin [Sphingomonas aerophila]MBB5716047.1 porin [Sphingomonas aerophila]
MQVLTSMPAFAEDPVQLDLTHKVDVVGVGSADRGEQIYYLDNLDLTGTAELEPLIGWTGGTLHVHLLNNLGGQPNNRAATLQGVNNIEVESHRFRLFEAWFEQKLGEHTSVRAGLYDLNSEFYQNDASGLLIAPAFGVGSEIAATGPNGPSIFPSTALAVRIDQRVGETGFARAAVLNASAGTLGDPHGVNLTFDDGALLIGEVGVEKEGRGRIALGMWTYTLGQEDVRATDASGAPRSRSAHGAYLTVEAPLAEALSGFVRVGISDGHTTPFHGGWQAGVLLSPAVTGRPDSQFSLGVNQAYLAADWRKNLRDERVDPAHAESALEITYSDRLSSHVTIQPDLQLVLDADGDRGREPVVVAGLRAKIEI